MPLIDKILTFTFNPEALKSANGTKTSGKGAQVAKLDFPASSATVLT